MLSKHCRNRSHRTAGERKSAVIHQSPVFPIHPRCIVCQVSLVTDYNLWHSSPEVFRSVGIGEESTYWSGGCPNSSHPGTLSIDHSCARSNGSNACPKVSRSVQPPSPSLLGQQPEIVSMVRQTFDKNMYLYFWEGVGIFCEKIN